MLGCGYDRELFFFTLNGAPLSDVVFHSANFPLDSIRASVGLYASGVRLRLNLGHAPFVYSSELRLSILELHQEQREQQQQQQLCSTHLTIHT